jgi:phage-related minor tail protein
MAKTIGELFVSLNADTSKFEASMQKSLSKTQGFVKGHEAQFRKVGMAVTAAGAAITAAMGMAVKSYATAGDQAHKMALRTGLSTEAIGELSHAAKLSGTSIESLEKGMKRMSKTINEAGYGLESYTRAFDAIGVKLDTLEGKSPEEQFNILSAAVAGVADESKRAALAQDIFGRAGTSLLPMFEDGAEGLAAMRKEAHDLGLVFDKGGAKSAAVFNDAITKLKGSFGGIQKVIAEQIVPIMTPLIDRITAVIKKVGEWAQRNPGLARVLIVVTAAIGVLATVLGPIIMFLPAIIAGISTLTAILPALGAAFTIATGPIGLVIAAIVGLIAVGVLLVKHWDTIKMAMAKVWNGIVSVVESGVNLYIGYINTLLRGILGTINKIIQGINKIPKVNIPEITIPQIGEVSFGRIDTGAMAERRADKIAARQLPTGADAAAGMATGGGVKTIEVNNPLSPEDLEKIKREVQRDTEMRGYVKTGLQGA